MASGGIRDGMGAFGGIKTSLLLVLDFFGAPASSSCSMGLVKVLTQRLYWTQDLRAIAKNRNLIMTFPNGLANPLGIEFLEL